MGVGALVLLLGFGIAIFVTQRLNDLVALGVAHEINNSIGYVYSNLGRLEE